MLENLKELVAINSYDDDNIIIDYLKQKFSPISEEVLIVKNKENDNKSILIGLNTPLKDIEPIVLSGHIDTVAPDFEKYQTNPFELTLVDNKAYGLGSIDMKCFTAEILDNLNAMKSLRSPIVVALTTDEETNLLCVNNVIDKFKELNIKPKFTIVGEPTQRQINKQANGCYEYLVEVFGKAFNSSILEQGINSISVIAKLITFIESEQKTYVGLTSNCGVIAGGDIVNRVPDYCQLKFDVRSTRAKEVDEFLKIIEEKINELKEEYNATIKIKKLLEIPPLEIKNLNLINKLAKTFNLKINKFMGGCEAGYYQALSGDAIIFGVGDMSLAHKPNEYVNINEYNNYGKLLLNMLKTICELFY